MYPFQKIEPKWQKEWKDSKVYQTREDPDKPKYYVLDMFPYPSGAGLHVGHPKGYIATDIVSRFRRMRGYNVLHPMGWDAFGLPAENYAIKNKIHPQKAVEENIARFKDQLGKIGFSYDWEREINTTDPDYYKWTQWCFLKMFERGLAYESEEPINWCPTCKTGLANEDLENGRCERCDSEVEQKPIRQWVLRITDYAERLIEDLKDLDWEDSIKEQQLNWIGKSEGVEFDFQVKDSDQKITVYTTRIDTVYGVSYVVISPEHASVSAIVNEEHKKEVQKYREQAKKKTFLERTRLEKNKTGVFTGAYAVNPFNGREVPIYVADYVISGYGTGAVMAVPAHDERDWAFAAKYNLPVKRVIEHGNKGKDKATELFVGDGILIESGEFSGFSSEEAREKMGLWLEEKKLGKKKTQYKMKDWVFSRQRYWGEPIPMVRCQRCGARPLPYGELPVRLPDVKNYEPTDTGESPLAAIEDWVNTTCPDCGGPAKRETNTMPQWAGSCWYYLRYIDPKNDRTLVNPEKEKYWMNVDLYVGGAEHATRHLLYARFWHKVLYDVGAVSTLEPFSKLYHVGLILGEDNRKMSKRWGNVINPDEVVARYGADALRLYEMFMGPFSDSIPWSTESIKGVSRFLDKVWALRDNLQKRADQEIESLLHKTVKKVTEDIERFSFNTSVSAMMIFVNEAKEKITRDQLKVFLKILSPFAPHIAQELWSQCEESSWILDELWPVYDEILVQERTVEWVIQVNGKARDKRITPLGISQKEIEQKARESDKIKKYLEQGKIKKIIVVPDKLINFVI